MRSPDWLRGLGFLVENLRADDYSVLTAGTAEEAIELLAQSQPDLMLLDVVLPGMSGIDLCRQSAVATASTSRGIPTCRSSCFPGRCIRGISLVACRRPCPTRLVARSGN